MLTLKDFNDDETSYSCDANLDVSEVFFNSCCQQHEEAPCSEKKCFSAVDSGDKIWYFGGAEDADQSVPRVAWRGDEDWSVQVDAFDAQDSSRYFKSAVVEIGVSEHLTEKEAQGIPGGEPGRSHMDTRRTRSSVSGNFEKSHRGETKPMEIRGEGGQRMTEGRKVGWRELGRIEEDRLVEITPVMKGGEEHKENKKNLGESGEWK